MTVGWGVVDRITGLAAVLVCGEGEGAGVRAPPGVMVLAGWAPPGAGDLVGATLLLPRCWTRCWFNIVAFCGATGDWRFEYGDCAGDGDVFVVLLDMLDLCCGNTTTDCCGGGWDDGCCMLYTSCNHSLNSKLRNFKLWGRLQKHSKGVMGAGGSFYITNKLYGERSFLRS
jgi:hypothetical protein